MKWDGYLLRNSLGEMDCQLVTAINAYYHLTGRRIGQRTKRYHDLRVLCGAVAGAAHCVEKVWNRLGIERYAERFRPFEGDRSTLRAPIEACVWHKAYGRHSVLIVDRAPKCKAIRITNFKWATSLDGWIFEEDFAHLQCGDVSRPMDERWKQCWSFRLKGPRRKR